MAKAQGKKTQAGNVNASANNKGAHTSVKARIAESMMAELLAKKIKAGSIWSGTSSIYLEPADIEAHGRVTPAFGRFDSASKTAGIASRLTQAISMVRPDGSGFVSVYREGALLHTYDFDAEPAPVEAPAPKSAGKSAPVDAGKLASQIIELTNALKSAGFKPAQIQEAIQKLIGGGQ